MVVSTVGSQQGPGFDFFVEFGFSIHMWVGYLGLLPQPKDMHGVRLIAVGVNVNLNWFLSLYATQTDW